MALGATAREVMWLVLRQSLTMICIGVGAGLFVAVVAAQLMTRFVDGMLPAEPSTFVVMIAALVAAALLASFAPALRASGVDPMAALRGD
jgi:putative ABC transport system permease protein